MKQWGVNGYKRLNIHIPARGFKPPFESQSAPNTRQTRLSGADLARRRCYHAAGGRLTVL